MEVKAGQYYYAPHRRSWGVWKKGVKSGDMIIDQFITDFSTKIQAEKFVYKMNGWPQKKEEIDK